MAGRTATIPGQVRSSVYIERYKWFTLSTLITVWHSSRYQHPNFDCRYVDVWEQRGHDTLAIRPRTSSIVIPPFGDRQVAGALADIRAVQGAHPGRRTVYHIFRHAIAVCTGLHLRSTLCSFKAAVLCRRSAPHGTVHTMGTLSAAIRHTYGLARSNAGFIFFGTMLRSLAAPALEASAARRVPLSEARKGVDRAASTQHSGVLIPHDEECRPLSVLDPVAGLILDSAPSRLTPDIAARHALLLRSSDASKCSTALPFAFLVLWFLKYCLFLLCVPMHLLCIAATCGSPRILSEFDW